MKKQKSKSLNHEETEVKRDQKAIKGLAIFKPFNNDELLLPEETSEVPRASAVLQILMPSCTAAIPASQAEGKTL